MANRSYVQFLAASGMTNLADGVATIAWAWIATLLTRDAILVAALPIALRLPWFICALPAGVVTDRKDRKQLILLMDVIRAAAFLAAALSIWIALPLAEPPSSGLVHPHLYSGLLICAFIVGTAEVFRDNAAQTMLPALVVSEQLEEANGRVWSVEMVGNALLGPAIGAFLIAASPTFPFALNALAYLLAILLVWKIGGRFRPSLSAEELGDWRAELREGIEFLRNNQLLRSLAFMTGYWNLLFHMMIIALVLHAQENLGLTAPQYGLVLAAGAIGGIIGGLTSDRVVRKLGKAKSTQWALASSFPSFLLIGVAPNALILALVLAVFEFTGVIWNTVSVSHRQRTVPTALLGRVNSVYRLLAWGMMPVGLALSGIIVHFAQYEFARSTALVAPFFVAAVGSLLLTLWGWRILRNGFDS